MWKNIKINTQNIEMSTEKAVLIKMPNKSKYAGYKFFHPMKLVRYGSNYSATISYTNEFAFKLFKNGNGKHNRLEIIDSFEINVEEMEEAFECMESCTREKSKETYLVVEEPTKINKEVLLKEVLKK